MLNPNSCKTYVAKGKKLNKLMLIFCIIFLQDIFMKRYLNI